MALAPRETGLTLDEVLAWRDEDTRAEHDDAGVVRSAPFLVRLPPPLLEVEWLRRDRLPKPIDVLRTLELL